MLTAYLASPGFVMLAETGGKTRLATVALTTKVSEHHSHMTWYDDLHVGGGR